MKLLQFSTSHYCRKARLALGYKGIAYTVENLTPGLHAVRLKPMTGLTTLPVLLPGLADQPQAIADSSEILRFLQTYQPEPSYSLSEPKLQAEAWMLEDWLDESIGIATRFVYYDFRAHEGKSLDPSFASQLVIQVVRKQYGINPTTVALAEKRLAIALEALSYRWQSPYLLGNQFSVADIAAAALLSPLARIPAYQTRYPWLFQRIAEIHELCREPFPPGMESFTSSVESSYR